MTDDELMARGAAGDEDAFRRLVERWERPVFAFLERMVGSREEAQDLAQDTFLKVYQNAGRYRAKGQFKSWLFRIAGNAARSRLRRRKILRWLSLDPAEHDVPSPREGTDVALEREETRASVREALLRLPDRQRQALSLRQYEELSYQEIAVAMDTSVSAVEALLHRAMQTLRRELVRKKVAP